MKGKEIWKPIEGYEGVYEISNMGRVRNANGRIRNSQNNGNGYRIIKLYRNGKGIKFFIHRLVAKAFIPNPQNKPWVNHLDECPANNKASNLEWCTEKENANYGTGRIKMRQGIIDYWETHPFHNCKPVRCVETGEVYPGIIYASRATGACNTNIKKCIRGERHTAGGYHWEFA